MAKEKQQDVQGEGNRDAAHRYNEATKTFIENDGLVRSEGTEQISAEDAAEAEVEGRSRAKEFDPAVTRDHNKPTER